MNGYGFIECAETRALYNQDVFMHKMEYMNCGMDVGEECKFEISLSEKGQPRVFKIM